MREMGGVCGVVVRYGAAVMTVILSFQQVGILGMILDECVPRMRVRARSCGAGIAKGRGVNAKSQSVELVCRFPE